MTNMEPRPTLDISMKRRGRSLSRRRRLQWLGVVGASVGAASYLYAVDPSGGSAVLRCPIYTFTGLYCPGCGTSRALHQLLHGNVGTAVKFNPLSLALLPVLSYSLASFTAETFLGRGHALPALVGAGRPTKLLMAVVMAFSVLRNIPVYPFYLLAPHRAGSKPIARSA
jgi:hypothetical protein